MMTSARGQVLAKLRFIKPLPNRVSLAVQASKEEADINTIVKNFGLTGNMPQNIRVPLRGDYTKVIDYRGAMDALRLANNSFAAMPWEVRKRFSNDAGEFVDFVMARNADGGLTNLEEMRKMGLAVAEVPAEKDEFLDTLKEIRDGLGSKAGSNA